MQTCMCESLNGERSINRLLIKYHKVYLLNIHTSIPTTTFLIRKAQWNLRLIIERREKYSHYLLKKFLSYHHEKNVCVISSFSKKINSVEFVNKNEKKEEIHFTITIMTVIINTNYHHIYLYLLTMQAREVKKKKIKIELCLNFSQCIEMNGDCHYCVWIYNFYVLCVKQ